MQVKFNQNSWHAKLYKAAYVGSNLPENLCPYFWKVVISIFALPLTWWTYLFKGAFVSHNDRAAMGALSLFGIAFLNLGGHCVAKDVFNQGGGWLWFWGFVCAVGIAATIVLLFFLLILFIEWLESRTTGETDSVVISFINAKVEKICPHIDWEK